MSDARQRQVERWRRMRRTGKVRHVGAIGLGAACSAGAVMVAVAWLKSGELTLTTEAIVAFVMFGAYGAAQSFADWKRLETIYPDIG